MSESALKRGALLYALIFIVKTCAGAILTGQAFAQSAKEVAIGGTAELDRDPQKSIAGVGLQPSIGTFAIGTEDKTSILVYIASKQGAGGLKTTVTYKTGSDTKSVVVTLRDSAPTLTDPNFYDASFKAIFVLFILAVLVESGLALLFRWRPFLDTFDSRSTNAVVAFVFSYIFVQAFSRDITTALVNVYSETRYAAGTAGLILIAGGSAGVRRILQTFGFRAPSAIEDPPHTPPVNEAWIPVTLIRKNAVGPVSVQIGAPGTVAVAGTITGRGVHQGLLGYILRDKGRFPNAGGYRVTPGQYEIRVAGLDVNGAQLNLPVWGLAQIACRALVDVQFGL